MKAKAISKTTFLFFFFLLCMDIASKYYIHHFIPKMSASYPFYPYGGVGVFRSFLGGIEMSIVHIENLGAAWGMFSSYGSQLFWLRLAIILILLTYLLFFNKDTSKRVPFLFIVTGAIGNILDFSFYHHVIDMFYLKFWSFSYPIFNFADCMITFGIFCLFFQSFRSKKKFTKNHVKAGA